MSKISIEGNASGTGTFTIASPNTNTSYTLTLPQGTGTVVANNVNSAIVAGTAVASTSGTSIDFTGIPSWVKRITVMFDGVSYSATDTMIVQLGDSGGIETTGYFAQAAVVTGSNTCSNSTYTTGFGLLSINPANTNSGNMILCNVTGNTWAMSATNTTTTTNINYSAGSKTLSDILTQVRITTINGTATFDAGSINILYE